MESTIKIAEEAIEYVEAGDLESASKLLINGLLEMGATCDEREAEIKDQLAFYGLRISKQPKLSAQKRLKKSDLKKIEEKIAAEENSLIVCAQDIFRYFHDLNSLAYEGTIVRKMPMRRPRENDSSPDIFSAEERLHRGYSLSESHWLNLIKEAQKQLDYYEGWLPAPRSGVALRLASRDWGYIKKGAYPEYAKLINERSKIEAHIKDARKAVTKLSKLFEKHKEASSKQFYAQIAQRQVIEDIKSIVGQ